MRRPFMVVLAFALAPTVAAAASCGTWHGIEPQPPEGDADASAPADGDASDTSLDGDASADHDACASPAACAPQTLAKLDGPILRIVASDAALYVGAAGGTPSVFRIATSAPDAVLDLDPHGVVPEELRSDSSIVVGASGEVYWGTANGLRRRDADAGVDARNGAGLVTMSELGAPVAGVRFAEGRLQYTVAGPSGGAGVNSGHLASCALPGCTDPQIASYTTNPIDVIVVGGTRWWLGTDPSLTNLAFRGPAGAIGGEQLQPSRMVTDGARIFWSALDGLRMFTLATNALVELSPVSTTAADRVNGIVLDADATLYVTQGKDVKRCTVAAGKCTFTTLASSASVALDIAVDASFVYWGTASGSILRFRK